MNKNSYRGKNRHIAITTIKKALNLPAYATPREKMQAVAAYNANHPEYPRTSDASDSYSTVTLVRSGS